MRERGRDLLELEVHITDGSHVVQLYDREESLAAAVAAFLGAGFVSREGVIVVATPAHRRLIEVALEEAGVELGLARASGQFVCLDAAAMLDTFMVDGMPDGERFRTSIGGLIGDVATARSGVRVYGEMVAVLWDEGNVLGAIALESLWNDLAATHAFSLFCAYPKALVSGRPDGLDAVCTSHSAVVPDPELPSGDPHSAVRRLEPTVSAAKAARRFAQQTLAEWGEELACVEEAILLIVSELVTNAARHTGMPFLLILSRGRDHVRVEVLDRSAAVPAPVEFDTESDGGRGLHIVGAVSTRWGTEVHDHGKTVWAEVEPAV